MKLTHIRSMIVSVLLWVACSSCGQHKVVATEPRPAADLAAYRSCQKDDECTWVNNGCCDCANGGEDIAVATSKKDAFRALFSCNNNPCSAMMVEPACGTGTVACEAGLCVYRPKTP